VIELIHQERGSVPRYYSFRKYAEPFFVWDRCPHIRRLREEGKSITRRHAKIQCQRLEKHVLLDPFASKQLAKITRADVLELRSRLLEKNAPATVNKALGVVKVIFREALYREEATVINPVRFCRPV
jgi:predicted RecB family nuclease